MNKKIIKYLIWTIIIAAVLILMPIKETKADLQGILNSGFGSIPYNEFKGSYKLFCLNKGYPYDGSNFTKKPFSMEQTGIKDDDINVLKYIVAESCTGRWDKQDINGYIPQQAIWKLVNSSNVITKNNTEAIDLINEGRAYNEYCKQNVPVPKIIKVDSNKFAVYYTEFKYSDQVFTNLINVKIDGVVSNNYEVEDITDANGYTHRRVYTVSNVLKIDVAVTYETARTVEFTFLESPERTTSTEYLVNEAKVGIWQGGTNWALRVFHDNGGYYSYYCARCENYQDPMQWEKRNYGKDIYVYYCSSCDDPQSAGNVLYTTDENTFYIDNGTEHNGVEIVRTTTNYNSQNLLYGDGTISEKTITVPISFIQPVTLNFTKKDFNGNRVNGARINISGGSNVGSLSANSITIGNGSVKVTPANGNSGTFTIGLSETAPTGYQAIPYTTLTVSYNNGSVTGITRSNSTFVTVSGSTVTIKNKPKVDLIINKTDPLIGGLANARFKIELTNAEHIDGYQIAQVGSGETQNPPTVVYVKTDGNGQIKLTGIVPTSGQEGTITAKITEVEVPTANGYYYKLLENPITVTMTYDNGKWTETGIGSISGNVLTVEIQNQPYIELKGMVWEDGQKGVKDVAEPDGLNKNGEKGIPGVLVGLYSIKENSYYTVGGYNPYRITDENGKYSFVDVPKTNEGYKIVFSYDGINWQETKSIRSATGGDSHASENATQRVNFNNRFKTISKGQSNDGTVLNYTKGNNVSTLNVDMKGTEKGTENFKYQMAAESGILYTVQNINCGLVNKNFDLAIGTDVKSAELRINEKVTTYNYAQLMNGQLNADFQNNSSTAEDVIYNLYLYSSDYNYRISDYKTDTREENKNTFINNIAYFDKLHNNFDNLKELEAYVTYTVILKNQTTYNARVDEFVYYYDEAYTPHAISTNEYNYSIDTSSRKITFTIKDNTKFNLTNPNYRVEVDLTFRINEKSDGSLVVNETATNVTEITKYSTEIGGLIDKDSAPGNGITNGQITQYEDDTDEAKGLNIVLRTDETRIITGKVIEDVDKDGKLEDNEPKVNGVVVQLIEIKKIGGQYYEYIWQETQTGSNVVLATPRNGYSNEKYQYTNNVTEDGKFEFKDFLPGNYIIRYIYGDVPRTWGAYREIQQKYNGQDYKSTVDSKYQQEWYNTAGYTVGDSVARDNEARRLEVMSHSTIINEDMYQKEQDKVESRAGDENWKYHFTWMCAETSKINIPVDDVENAKTKTAENKTDTTATSYQYTANGDIVLFGDMNFGLALRPQTNIVLEKHITSLKITPSGTGVLPIVDAKALDIEKIVNGEEIQVKGITTGLATIKSTRDNRGFWQVATDVEELMQGAELEVEYTYVLRNDSEPDYLSSELVNEYEANTTGYSNYLLNIVAEGQGNLKNNTKGKTHTYGTYLGEYYYTGNKGANDTLVTSRIEKFEEALNNDFTFNESEATAFVSSNENIVKENVYGVNKADGTKEIEINTVVKNKTVTPFLLPKLGESHKTTTETEKGTADWSRTLKLTTTLSTVAGGELGANLPSYIAEVLQYSNAAGRIDMNAKIANLSYVHSDDSDMTMASDNEQDEFWAESIIITKPTGEDKVTPLQIALIGISAIATLGVGIVLIKKFVLNK